MDYATEEAWDGNAMQQAAMQQGFVSNKPRDSRLTPIDEAVERMFTLVKSTSELRLRLDENADRILGPVPTKCAENGAGFLNAASALPPLMDTLLSAVGRLEREISKLSEAAERNCWAV